MDSLMLFINVLVTAAGIYMAYESYKMLKTKEIAMGIYLAKELHTRKCKDEEAYCNYTAPKGIVTGLLVAVFSGLSCVGDYYASLAIVTKWGFIPVLACYVWFIYYVGKANRKYF